MHFKYRHQAFWRLLKTSAAQEGRRQSRRMEISITFLIYVLEIFEYIPKLVFQRL